MSSQYNLIFRNNSNNAWSACLYQTDPGLANVPLQSLAWFARAAAPTTQVNFTWAIDYSFVWDETGVLQPGVVFDASQTWPADLTTKNAVTLTCRTNPYEYFTFADQTQGPNQGSLYLHMNETIPMDLTSCGIGMSGAGVFAVQARPNLSLVFTPNPVYWITFGSYIQGEVLDLNELTNTARIDFPPGVSTMYATLNADNTWTISPNPHY